MLWDNDEKKNIKYLLLDFLVKSQNDFRDVEPFEISLSYAYEYIDDFIEKEKMYGMD